MITNEDADEYISGVIEPLQLLEILPFVVLGLGGLLLLSALVAAGVIYKRHKQVI